MAWWSVHPAGPTLELLIHEAAVQLVSWIQVKCKLKRKMEHEYPLLLLMLSLSLDPFVLLMFVCASDCWALTGSLQWSVDSSTSPQTSGRSPPTTGCLGPSSLPLVCVYVSIHACTCNMEKHLSHTKHEHIQTA